MYTRGKWIYNKDTHNIESDSEYLIEPDGDDSGVPISVISTFGAMSGNDPNADIKLICAAPEMLDLLYNMLAKYDITTGGNLSMITIDEIEEIKRIVNLTK